MMKKEKLGRFVYTSDRSKAGPKPEGREGSPGAGAEICVAICPEFIQGLGPKTVSKHEPLVKRKSLQFLRWVPPPPRAQPNGSRTDMRAVKAGRWSRGLRARRFRW